MKTINAGGITMKQFIILIFSIIFVGVMVPEFTMCQENETGISLQKDGIPLYIKGGISTQPLGLFKNRLVSDSVIKDFYEIMNTSTTLGYSPGIFGLNISLTAYSEDVLITKLIDFSDLPPGDGRQFREQYITQDDISDEFTSFIGNVTLSPKSGLIFSIYYDTEPRHLERNDTAGITINYEIGKFTLDAEYIGAIKKEISSSDDKIDYGESAWFGTIAYQVREPFEIAIRYETFDDDLSGKENRIIENRFSLSGKFTLFEKGRLVTNLMAEYRQSAYEKHTPNYVDSSKGEFFTKLAIEF